MSPRRKTAPDPARQRSSSEPRPYRQPRLDRLGDLRSLTLGTSAGLSDSGMGSGFFQQP